MKTEKQIKAAAAKAHAAQVKIAEELASVMYEAAVNEAFEMNSAMIQALLSHKEVCAQKRASAYETTSIFTKSINENSSCYNIECLLNDFHTESELYKLMNTSEMLAKCNTREVKRARIRAHLSHLKRKFSQTVRYIEKRENSKVLFKFELK
jgi:hypothetical protein